MGKEGVVGEIDIYTDGSVTGAPDGYTMVFNYFPALYLQTLASGESFNPYKTEEAQ